MKNKFFTVLFLAAFGLNSAFADDIVKNKFFQISMPEKLKGTYEAEINKDSIIIYDIKSKEAGFGGLAFGYKVYKHPKDHSMMPGGKKVGELNTLFSTYDMVLIQPTDVQFDYTKKEPKHYKDLYELAQKVEIKGVHKSTYNKNQGMKGEDLYKKVLARHIKAINEKWDSKKLEKNNMSYMYNVIAQSGENPLDKIGYAFYDVNDDGIDELLIGEIAQKNWKGVIYDIYTMVDRKPKHVISGGNRDRYFVSNDIFLCREYSSGADENGWLIYILVENSTELFPQMGFKYDGYKDKKNPWFISYNIDSDKDWQNVSKKAFDKRKKTFDKYERFNYTPLSKIK